MATIVKEMRLDVAADAAWDAVRSVGEVHLRLAPGFVVDTALEGDTRVVTFANGTVVRERVVGLDDDWRRLAYSVVGGRAGHHHASFQVFPEGEARCRLVWITDVLPDDAAGPIRAMVEQGAVAIERTLGGGGASSRRPA